MKRSFNIWGNVLTISVVLLAIFLLSIPMGKYSTGYSVAVNVIFLLLGALVSGIVCTFLHEAGHLLFAKKNGFKVTVFKFWFFKWTLKNGGYEFSFTLPLSEAGATETAPLYPENVEKRIIKSTYGGLIFSFFSMILSIPAFFIYGKVPFIVFCILGTFLPVGAYFFVGNAFPMSSDGVFNDGGVIYALKKKTPEGVVMGGILKIQAELIGGKTPSEIDDKLYFDLPQLQEDSPYFINLLTLRYLYYLDKGDYVDAKKVTDRLLTLESYMSFEVKFLVKTYALYGTCTFDFDEYRADDYTAELEKYLNKSDDLGVLCAKTAYILYVRKEKDVARRFIDKGLSDAETAFPSGVSKLYGRLFDEMKKDLL